MEQSLGHLWIPAMGGAAVTWLVANLMAIARRTGSALDWYRLSGLVEAALAVDVALGTHQYAWLALGLGWGVGKVWAVPAILRRSLPLGVYEVKTRATPSLMLGSAALVGILAWAAGVSGLLLAALLTPFWLLTQRREVWLQAILLMEAEIALGFLSLGLSSAVGLADFLALAELLAMAVLLAWLYRRGAMDLPSLTTDTMKELRG